MSDSDEAHTSGQHDQSSGIDPEEEYDVKSTDSKRKTLFSGIAKEKQALQ